MGQREVRFSSAGTLAFEYEKQRSALSCVQNFNDRPNPMRIEKVMAKSKSKKFGPRKKNKTTPLGPNFPQNFPHACAPTQARHPSIEMGWWSANKTTPLRN